jgi:hypothetical protein
MVEINSSNEMTRNLLSSSGAKYVSGHRELFIPKIIMRQENVGASYKAWDKFSSISPWF